MDGIGQSFVVVTRKSSKCDYHWPDGSCFPRVSLHSFYTLQNIKKKRYS